MGEAIRAERLTKIYPGGILAVDHIDLEVKEGEIFAFLGPNGAGKTTTVKMLVTLLEPTEGDAWVAGYNIRREAEKVRESIGYVPQDLTADDELTGFENMYMQARFYGLSKEEARRRSRELLEFVGLGEAADRRVRSYSGGMRRRLELAMGIIHDPRILFLDEPTLGLDVQSRRAIWDHIQGMRRRGNLTIFLTTHYMEEADELADRIAIIDRGRIVALGTPQELKNSIGGDIIFIEADNDIGGILAELPDVKSYEFKKGRYRVKVSMGEEALPRILKALMERGVNVRSVYLKKPSLDEVFLEYTGRELREEEPMDVFKFVVSRRRRR